MVSKIITWVDRKALTKQIEFDIWDSGYVQGQRDAKAGIIKRLEQTKSPSHLWGGIGWAIALIKGETE